MSTNTEDGRTAPAASTAEIANTSVTVAAMPPGLSVWEALQRSLSPIEYRPHVVDGIEAAHHTTRTGVPYVIIRNPATNTYLKLDPREYDLLPLMDGTRTVKALVVEYYRRHDLLSLPRIAGLVRLLKANRFLTDPPFDVYAALEKRLRRPTANSLLLRLAHGFRQTQFPLRGVDGVLGKLYKAWGWIFFTRLAVLVGAAFAVLGPLLFLLELNRNRYPLFSVSGSYLLGILLMGALTVVTLFIHEMGHAVAVKRAGRYVPHAGVMIYYGFPAGYVDTTDIWMAPRRMRLLTSFAGPWTGLVLGGVCGLLFTLLPEGPVGAFLFAWSFVFLIDNLFNFNPFFELDGYYLLVDLLEKPMLRARSLAFVRGPLWTRLRRREPFTREERLFTWFGLASAVWSALALLLAVIFWEARLQRLVAEAWASGNLLAQGVVVVLGLAVGVPLALSLWALLNVSRRWISRQVQSLSGQVAARRYKYAISALKAIPLWRALPEARLLEVARVMRAERIDKGVDVVRQGEMGDRFYVIAEGTYDVLVDEQPVNQLGPGDYFGERALLNNVPRSATVVAREKGLLFSLGRQAFHSTLAHDLATQAQLKRALAYRAEVAQMSLFQGLTPSDLDLLVTRLQPSKFAAGETIIREGEPGKHFYLVRSGAVQVSKDGQVLRNMGCGEAFGEIALMLDVPRTATVQALEETGVLALSSADFHDLLARYLGGASALEQLSSSRLHAHASRVESAPVASAQ